MLTLNSCFILDTNNDFCTLYLNNYMTLLESNLLIGAHIVFHNEKEIVVLKVIDCQRIPDKPDMHDHFYFYCYIMGRYCTDLMLNDAHKVTCTSYLRHLNMVSPGEVFYVRNN